MPERSPKRARPKRAQRPLYHASKISDERFRKVLWHFACDDTVAQAAAQTGLSQNAVSTIFVKLRRFLTEAGMFTDPYGERDPSEGLSDEEDMDDLHFERHLIEFHFARLKAKRGFGAGAVETDHFAESHWRFHYTMLVGDRGGDAVHHIMHRHLLEMIRRCGPVGNRPSIAVRDCDFVSHRWMSGYDGRRGIHLPFGRDRHAQCCTIF